MSLFHRHQWKLVGRTYYPPTGGDLEFEAKGWSVKDSRQHLETMNFGMTRLEMRCTECGDIKFVTGAGTK